MWFHKTVVNLQIENIYKEAPIWLKTKQYNKESNIWYVHLKNEIFLLFMKSTNQNRVEFNQQMIKTL